MAVVVVVVTVVDGNEGGFAGGRDAREEFHGRTPIPRQIDTHVDLIASSNTAWLFPRPFSRSIGGRHNRRGFRFSNTEYQLEERCKVGSCPEEAREWNP
jgi:hypothetical protein